MGKCREASRLFGAALLLSSSSGVMAWADPPQADPAAQATTPTGNASPATQSSASDASETTSQDIIVTAQRRDESLSRTPVAVAVVTAEALDKAQIKTEQDLRFATPGLSIRAGISDGQQNFSLRGQSLDPFSNTRPGVLPYFNEVPIAGQGFATAFYDLQSVQVLKGPQGTLFGRSATGGAVLYTTGRPTFDFGGYASASYGNFDALQLEGAINVPIAKDVAALRVAGFYSEKNGFQRNLFDGSRVGDRKKEAFRASLLLSPGESFRNTTVYDYYHTNGQNTASVVSGVLPFTGNGPPYFPVALLYAGIATPADRATGIGTLQAISGVPAAVAAAQYDAYFADPRRTRTGAIGEFANQQARGYRVVNYDTLNLFRANVDTVVNTTEIDLGENATLKNIFGYQNSVAKLAVDVDSTPFGQQMYDRGPQTTSNRQYTDELQISGKAFDGRLDYVAGVFYAKEYQKYAYDAGFFDIIFGGFRGVFDYKLTSKTYAGYAQGTYKLNDDGLSVTGGVRYTSEKVGETLPPQNSAFPLCTVAGYDCDQSATYKNWSWTGGIQDQVNSDLLIYAVTRRSYKSGGFNALLPPKVGTAATGGNSFGEERATDVEGGLKFNGSLGSMPFRTNVAGYYIWTKNNQRAAYVLLNGAPGATSVNVPKQRTYGLEFDAQIRPVEWLGIGGTFNYTNSKYKDGRVFILADINGVPGVSTQIFDQIPDTPRTSGGPFADVTLPVTDTINVLAHGDLYFQSKTTTAPRSGNFAGTTISSYTIANFRLGLEDRNVGWSLIANLKNAFDKRYFAGGASTGETIQLNRLFPAEPRTITVEARFKF